MTLLPLGSIPFGLLPGDRLALVAKLAPAPPHGVAAWPEVLTVRSPCDSFMPGTALRGPAASFVELPGSLYYLEMILEFYRVIYEVDLERWRELLDEVSP